MWRLLSRRVSMGVHKPRRLPMRSMCYRFWSKNFQNFCSILLPFENGDKQLKSDFDINVAFVESKVRFQLPITVFEKTGFLGISKLYFLGIYDLEKVHRRLGRHYSQVKHLRQSQWEPRQLEMLKNLVENGANKIWEHNLLDPVRVSIFHKYQHF